MHLLRYSIAHAEEVLFVLLGRCVVFVQAIYRPLFYGCFLVQQGQTSKEYMEIKKMMFVEPDLLHAMLKSLADSIGDYANYQVLTALNVFGVSAKRK